MLRLSRLPLSKPLLSRPRIAFLATAVMLSGACALVYADEPRTAEQLVERGMQRFVANRIEDSIKDFDRAARLKPSIEPHLWQRGISLYYAGRFDDGARQFEIHRRVNPNDVENAAWHFLCIARQKGIDQARQSLIRIDTSRDRRVPMAEIYNYYAGQGSAAQVLTAARKDGSPRAQMYAHLYLGLFAEAAGQPQQAQEHLTKAAAVKMAPSYMQDVAKVHLLQRKWKSEE